MSIVSCAKTKDVPLAVPDASDSSSEVCFDKTEVTLGSEYHYPEERPLRKVSVTPFCIDKTEVSVAEFKHFVEATGYRTVAETGPSRDEYPGYPDEFFQAGSAVFVYPGSDQPGKWIFSSRANWLDPHGTSTSLVDSDKHPVVHIAIQDARAYANWKGRRLPSEAEWEFAAKHGKNEMVPGSNANANTWEGPFPMINTQQDGYMGTAPVGSFKPDQNGIYDLLGNVWEWTDDHYDQNKIERYVIKGGSHLCAPNYCARYRSSARQPQESGMGTSHIGFRTVRDKNVIIDP